MFKKTNMDKFNEAYLKIINGSKKTVIKEDPDENELTENEIQILKIVNQNPNYTADNFSYIANIDYGPNDDPDTWNSLKERGYLLWDFEKDDDYEPGFQPEGYGYATGPQAPGEGFWPCWNLDDKGIEALQKRGIEFNKFELFN